jgi:SAM-dependent methyltransferase
MNENSRLTASYDKYKSCGEMNNVPGNVSYLSPTPNEQFPNTTIEFFWNEEVRHGKILNYQPPAYYQDYLMTTTYSAAMQNLQANQAAKLRKLLSNDPTERSFVEIGCGDGSFLRHASNHFTSVIGIEPSKRFASEAIANGFKVVNKYVSSKEKILEEKFDAFVSRQVFEHLPDPLDVLEGIRDMLKPGAVGMIEVPNGNRALRLCRFFEFFPDHVNYYSVNSLVALASDAGLTTIECIENFGQDYLELWVRNDIGTDRLFQEMVRKRTEICRNLSASIQQLANDGKRICIWGAGAKTLSIVTMLDGQTLANLCYVIDSDPHKHSLFIPNSRVQVISLQDALKEPPDAVLILALTYQEEIRGMVRKHFSREASVLSLTETGSICELA